MRAKKLGFSLLAMGIILTPFHLEAGPKPKGCAVCSKVKKPNLLQVIRTRVLDTIEHSQAVPGLKSDEFAALKPDLLKIWEQLFSQGVFQITGADQAVRPSFVALQGVIEHVLASELNGEITALKGIIHTSMPATPLCTNGEISNELVDPSIEVDAARLFTIQARATIIRDYLFKGGDLYIVYPKNGLKKRTEEQQQVYQQELKNHPDHLFDAPVDAENIPADLIGATYLFEDKSGKTFVFAIKMTQANNPKEMGSFGLWFGPLEKPAIQERVQAVSAYFTLS